MARTAEDLRRRVVLSSGSIRKGVALLPSNAHVIFLTLQFLTFGAWLVARVRQLDDRTVVVQRRAAAKIRDC